jgi:hypothetical protein
MATRDFRLHDRGRGAQARGWQVEWHAHHANTEYSCEHNQNGPRSRPKKGRSAMSSGQRIDVKSDEVLEEAAVLVSRLLGDRYSHTKKLSDLPVGTWL